MSGFIIMQTERDGLSDPMMYAFLLEMSKMGQNLTNTQVQKKELFKLCMQDTLQLLASTELYKKMVVLHK